MSVCACRRPGWGFLQSVNRWACDITPSAPSLPPYISASGQSVLKEIQSHENPPPSLGYHDNEHWSRQHLAVVRKEEVEGGGGRRQEERQKEKRKGRKEDNNSILRNSFWIFSLFLSSFSTVSTSPLLPTFTCCTASKWKEIGCSPLSSELDNVTWQMPLMISGMASVIPLWCGECMQPASP